jgi:hypothetical protein
VVRDVVTKITAIAAVNLVEEAANRQREIMWFGVFRTLDKISEMSEQWNKMSPRAGSTG